MSVSWCVTAHKPPPLAVNPDATVVRLRLLLPWPPTAVRSPLLTYSRSIQPLSRTSNLVREP